MSTYLKLDTVLPAGINYLDTNKITLPPSVINLGNIASAFKFTLGLSDFIGTTANVVGTPTKDVDGYFLGNAGYIDTGLKETDEFTWIALFKVKVTGVESPVISNFVDKTLSTTGFHLGGNVSRQNNRFKLSNSADSAVLFANGNMVLGKWCLVAVTRKFEPTTGFKYHIAHKPEGIATEVKSSIVGTSSKNTEQNVQIGWTSKGGVTIANSSQLINFASIHTKGLSALELTTLMSNLVSDFATQGINL